MRRLAFWSVAICFAPALILGAVGMYLLSNLDEGYEEPPEDLDSI